MGVWYRLGDLRDVGMMGVGILFFIVLIWCFLIFSTRMFLFHDLAGRGE